MIVYQSDKRTFLDRVSSDSLFPIIRDGLGINVGPSEQHSWKATARYMYDILRDKEIPDDSTVAIEYQIPMTSKRIDFILAGQGDSDNDNAIVIELKQWEKVGLSGLDGIVETDFYGGREVSHPSYQAWAYVTLLKGFNEAVYEGNINLQPCAYLHNYFPDEVIRHEFYKEYTEKAPVFLQGDEEKEKLQDFIKSFIKYGDKNKVIYRIENGKIKPSKALTDSLSKMLKGNEEFVMIDEQKVVYETAMKIAKQSTSDNKHVFIIAGGPGTGKSVVAINLLVQLNKLGLFSQYVTKNAAPRDVYASVLTGSFRKSEISNLFTGSGSFIGKDKNLFDVLVIDEAHRLNEKSGMMKNLGENQIKEIIEASKCSIFFIDENQKVTWHDIGESEAIINWANTLGATVHQAELSSQFRCSGSDGYIAWLDRILQIRDTANINFEDFNYDFKVFDDPNKLRDEIFEKNKEKNKARLVAGYCWDWLTKNNKSNFDIRIPEHNFFMKWNLANDGNLWILKPESVNEVGCIHTCQGLELEYVAVIIGDDFVIRDGKVVTQPEKRARTDSSLKGYGTLFKTNPEEAKRKADYIIKNTYRTLMTRGMKGCYVYSTDKETSEYFKKLVTNNRS